MERSLLTKNHEHPRNMRGRDGEGTQLGIAKFNTAEESDAFLNKNVSDYSAFVVGKDKTMSL